MGVFGTEEKEYTVQINPLKVRATSKKQALEFALRDILKTKEEGTLEVKIAEDSIAADAVEAESSAFLFNELSLEDFRDSYGLRITKEDTIEEWVLKEDLAGFFYILASTDKEELIAGLKKEDPSTGFDFFKVSDTKEGSIYVALS